MNAIRKSVVRALANAGVALAELEADTEAELAVGEAVRAIAEARLPSGGPAS